MGPERRHARRELVASPGLSRQTALAAAVRRELDRARTAPPLPSDPDAARVPDPPPAELAALLALPTDRFVPAAYALLLGREPDDDGARHYASLLADGSAGRLRVLGALRDSPEGRVRAVALPGLRARLRLQRLYAFPVAGRFVRLATALPALPAIMRALEAQQAQLHRLDENAERARLDRRADREALDDLDSGRRGLAARLDRLGRELFELRAALDRQAAARAGDANRADRIGAANAAARHLATLLGDGASSGEPVLALDDDRRALVRRLEAAGLDGRIAVASGEAAAALALDRFAAATVADAAATLDEAARALRPGGLLLLAGAPDDPVTRLLLPLPFTAPAPSDAGADGAPALLLARRR